MAILTSDHVKMTSLLEKTVALIAPHRCIICSNYNNIACVGCISRLPHIEAPFCVRCGVTTTKWQPCAACKHSSALDAAWVHSHYEGMAAELIRRFKFDHARDAYQPLARLLVTPLPRLTGFTVVPVPTVASHIRQRSYDHTALLAKEAARLLALPMANCLERTQHRQQIGRTRAERRQVATSIGLHKTPPIKVVLVDDVCTTGSTLEACAAILKKTGAAEVYAAVVAWQPLKVATKKDR